MTEVKKEERKFRNPGDPLRVQICKLDDTEAGVLNRTAVSMGFVPYEHKGWVCVDVLGGGLCYRAPDAIFQEVESGLYTFTTDENGRVTVQGPQ